MKFNLITVNNNKELLYTDRLFGQVFFTDKLPLSPRHAKMFWRKKTGVKHNDFKRS